VTLAKTSRTEAATASSGSLALPSLRFSQEAMMTAHIWFYRSRWNVYFLLR